MPLVRTRALALVLFLLAWSAAWSWAQSVATFAPSGAGADLESRLAQLEAEVADLTSRLEASQRAAACGPAGPSGLFAGAGLVFARPQFKEAFQVSLINTAIGALDLKPFSYDYSPTLRAWAGYLDPRGFGIRSACWLYDQAGDATQVTATDQMIAGAQAVSVIFPATILADEPGETLVATDGLKVHVVDLQGVLQLDVSGLEMILGGGLRYVALEQELASRVLSPIGLPNAVLAWTRSYEGLGPVIYTDGRRRLGQTGFSVVGGGGGALVFGNKNLERFAVGVIDDVTPLFLQLEDADEVVGMGEVNLGLEWRGDCGGRGRATIRAMYEAQLWAEAGAPTLGFLGFEGFQVSLSIVL